jgi:hypothetical protein
MWIWIWDGEAMSSSPWEGLWERATRTSPPRSGMWIWNGEGFAYRLGFFSPALMGTGSQFWRGGTGQVAKAVKAQGGL